MRWLEQLAMGRIWVERETSKSARGCEENALSERLVFSPLKGFIQANFPRFGRNWFLFRLMGAIINVSAQFLRTKETVLWNNYLKVQVVRLNGLFGCQCPVRCHLEDRNRSRPGGNKGKLSRRVEGDAIGVGFGCSSQRAG